MFQPLRVLFITEAPADALFMVHELERCGYDLAHAHVNSPTALHAALTAQCWDVIIADFDLAQFNVMAALTLCKEHASAVPFIIVASTNDDDHAVATMKAGARDFLAKRHFARLGSIIDRELREMETRRAYQRAEAALQKVSEEIEVKVEARTRALTSTNLKLRRTLHKLKRLSRKDALTGLLNRRMILERAAGEWARWRRYVSAFSIMIIDADDFKGINDRYGHLAGDQALKLLAHAIKRSIRKVDLVGRLGGEEFVVVMPETSAEGALAAGQNIMSNIRQSRLRTDDFNIQITVSIGIATVSLDDKNFDSVLQRADMALYAAKRQGKDRAVVSACGFSELMVASV